MFTQTIGDAIITVSYDGPRVDSMGTRNGYHYVITTTDWQYVGNDLSSGVGAAIDVEDAARVLFSFLLACAESRGYRERNGYGGENADLFPGHVGRWAEENSDEIGLLSIDPAELD